MPVLVSRGDTLKRPLYFCVVSVISYFLAPNLFLFATLLRSRLLSLHGETLPPKRESVFKEKLIL